MLHQAKTPEEMKFVEQPIINAQVSYVFGTFVGI